MTSSYDNFRSRVPGATWPSALVLSCAVALAILVGCVRTEPRLTAAKLDDPGTAVGEARDHLILALDFLDSFHEYDPNEIIPRITNHLQTWISEAKPVDAWLADPLFGRLPERIQLSKQPITLSRLQFQTADLSMLREAMWMQEIAQHVCQRDVSDPDLAEWLGEQEGVLGIDGVRDLGCAIELFDWVVRNVQLEATPEPDDEGWATSGRQSWEALLLGRGDAWVRGEIFILLCRQARIPALMLGIETDSGWSRPWAVGVWVGGQLFLFDAALGLPIPAEGGVGVVDLAQLLDQPELLRQLDIDGSDYAIADEDLKRLVALFQGTVAYLSQRMLVVENALPASHRMVLSTAPSALARQIREAFPDVAVELWTLPYDTIQQRSRLLQEAPQSLQQLEQELSLFLEKTPLAAARREHFRGRFASDPPKQGAKALYVACRIPDVQINAFDASSLRGMPGVPRELNERPDLLAQLVPAAKARARLAKEYASYWLGLIAFDEGRPDVAADYFRKRTLEAYPNGIWPTGARYNLARCLELLGASNGDDAMLSEAVLLYEMADSPQSHGNRVRARRLRQRSLPR